MFCGVFRPSSWLSQHTARCSSCFPPAHTPPGSRTSGAGLRVHWSSRPLKSRKGQINNKDHVLCYLKHALFDFLLYNLCFSLNVLVLCCCNDQTFPQTSINSHLSLSLQGTHLLFIASAFFITIYPQSLFPSWFTATDKTIKTFNTVKYEAGCWPSEQNTRPLQRKIGNRGSDASAISSIKHHVESQMN